MGQRNDGGSAAPSAGHLVGRERERAWLTRALEQVEGGQPRVLIVTGNAGIGKTRLVQEVVAGCDDRWLVAVGHCVEEGESGLPYAPLTGILAAIAATGAGAELLDDVERTAPGLLPLVRNAAADTTVDTTSGLSQLRLLDALVHLLGAISSQRPTLLVIEDLHWADRSTRAFISFLCRNVVTQRLAVILTARTDELHRKHPLRPLLGELVRLPGVERTDLDPLDVDDLAELLANVNGAPLPRRAVRRIADRSGGNPFFAEQLLAVGADRADARPPDELSDILLHRVDRMTAEARYVLEVASLAGQRIEHELLVAVCDRKEGEISAALHEAADSRLFEPERDGLAYRFRHALLAEVIAADMLPSERKRLHARYAEVLAGYASPAMVARHLLDAGDLPGAFAASIDAAAEAAAIAAPDDALTHWERVLDLWEHGGTDDHVRVGGRTVAAREAATAAENAGEVNRAVQLARLAVETAENDADRARARLLLIPLLSPLVTGRAGEYVDEASAAIVEAGNDPVLAVQARYALARAHFIAGHFDESVPLADAAHLDGARLDLPAVSLGARATAFLARCELGLDQRDQESSLVEAALDSDDVETGLWVLTKLADWWWPTDLERGERLGVSACDYAARHGVRTSVRGVWARETLALCRLLNGNWDAVEALAEAEPLPTNDLTCGTIAIEAQVDIARGRLGLARRRLDFAHRVAPDALSHGFIAIARLSLHLAEGDPAAAVAACVESVARLPPSTGFADLEASLVARGVGALADAREQGIEPAEHAQLLAAADRVEERAAAAPNPRLTDSPLSLLRAHRSRLDHSDAELWRRAVTQREKRPYDNATCRFHLAEALLEDGDATSAATELTAAVDTFRTLGAVVMLERATALADRARIRLGTQEDRREVGDPWGLTDRELQVLRLVAEGCTNRQVGEALFISARTAGVHVSNILTKLGAANRGEAASIARKVGLLTE